jgi:hypothetical protein
VNVLSRSRLGRTPKRVPATAKVLLQKLNAADLATQHGSARAARPDLDEFAQRVRALGKRHIDPTLGHVLLQDARVLLGEHECAERERDRKNCRRD